MRELLGAIPYGTNEVYLHTDEALMPRRRATWASWNFLGSSRPGSEDAAVCVTYWLNNLQVRSDLLPVSHGQRIIIPQALLNTGIWTIKGSRPCMLAAGLP